MNVGKIGQYILETAYVIFLSIILANYWVGLYMGVISPLPLMPGLTYLMAPICGALIYFFFKSVRTAFYATVAMCIMACIITAAALSTPILSGIGDTESLLFSALYYGVKMFIYIFSFAVGGCFVAAYISPD